MQKVDLSTSFTKLNENCGLPDFFTDYQIRHLGNPSGLPGILLKIDPCIALRKQRQSESQSFGIDQNVQFYSISEFNYYRWNNLNWKKCNWIDVSVSELGLLARN